MRPKRQIKSTQLKDFFYPVPKKKKVIEKDQKKTQKLYLNGRKSLRISPARSQSSKVVTSSSQTVQRLPLTSERVPANNRDFPSQAVNQAVSSPQNSNNPNGEELNELYTNTSLPSGYSGDLKQFILQKESISRHRRKLNIFKRRKVFVLGPWVAIQADTAFYINSAMKNDGYKYILVVVDCFSRRNWLRAMKSVTAEETSKNLESIINSMDHKPSQFASDQGNEFNVRNAYIYELLVERYGMIIYTLKAPLKASMVERFIRTMKGRIERYFTENNTERWVDILQDVSAALNKSINRSIGMAPIDVTFKNQKEVFKKLYGSLTPPSDCKLKVGDIVRIPLPKTIFTKGYKPGWTKELYKVIKVRKTSNLCYYRISTLTGETIDKHFYKQELNLVAKNGVSSP
jgi:hypothetical protein